MFALPARVAGHRARAHAGGGWGQALDQRVLPGPRPRRNAIAGQTLVIFAIMATLLFGTVGIAVDAGLAYLAGASAERAAAAGATAGVVYMPGAYGTAVASARSAVSQNGFTDGDDPGGRSVSVVVGRYPANCGASGVPCATNRLSVSVTQRVATTFTRVLGFGSHPVTVHQTAEYLRPIGLGQPGPQLGADDTTFGDGSTSNFFMLEQEGWAVPRHNGDAFTPDPTSSFTSDPAKLDLHNLNAQTGSDTAGGPVRRGGYNYLIFVPAGQSVQPRIYNPAFAPTNDYIPPGGRQSMGEGHFLDRTATDFTGDPTEYAQMAYTVFRVGSVFARQQDVPLSRMVVRPIDAFNAPTGYTDVYTRAATVGMPYVFHNWLDVGASDSHASDSALVSFSSIGGRSGSPLTGGANGAYYRLRVDSLDSNGNDPDPIGGPTVAAQHMKSAKLYSVEAWDPLADALCGRCTVSAMNDMAFQVALQSSGVATRTTVPLMQIPQEYAGRNVSIMLFDPSDLKAAPAPVVAAQVPTAITAAGSTITIGEQAVITSVVEWQPPPAATMQQYPCLQGGSGGPLGPPGDGPPQVSYYDGVPKNDNSNLLKSWLDGSTSEDPCRDNGNGYTQMATTQLSVGIHTISVVFPGNSYLLPVTTTVLVTVLAAAGPFTCSPTSANATNTIVPHYAAGYWVPRSDTGYWVAFAFAGWNGQPQGTVKLVDAVTGVTYRGPDPVQNALTDNFSSWWDLTMIPAGPHTLSIVYSGFGALFPTCKVSFSVVQPVAGVTPAPTPTPAGAPLTSATTITAAADPVKAGQLDVFTATVAGSDGQPASVGTTSFCVDDPACGAGSVITGCVAVQNSSAGIATCATPVSLPAGNYSVYAVYSGSSKYKPSSGSTSLHVIAGGGGGGGGGTAYHGGGGAAVLPNYRPGAAAAARLLAAVTTGIELKLLQPDGTTAHAVSVTDLGPSEYGTMPCPDFSPCPVAADYQEGAGNAALFTNDQSNNNIFNGKWLQFTISVPADYVPVANQYWSLQYLVQPNSNPEDTLTLAAGFHGAPVHIVP